MRWFVTSRLARTLWLLASILSFITARHARAQEGPSAPAEAPDTRTAQADPNNPNAPPMSGNEPPIGPVPRPPGQSDVQPPPTPPTPPSAAEAEAPPELDVPSELQSLRDDHQGLQTDLENFKFQWQRERDLHTAITTRGLLVSGTIQARVGWINQDQGGPNGTPVSLPIGSSYGRRSSFDISTAVLAFTGLLYKDYEEGRNLTYNLRFGASPQTAPVVNSNFVNLLDANIVYSILPTVDPSSPALTVTLGQQLLPFGLEASATEELKPIIRNATFTNPSYAPGAAATATGLGLGREIGLIVRGDLFPAIDYGYNYRQALIQYVVGIVNGNGINTPDDNDKKDLIGRLAFTVPSDYNSWLRQLTIGGTVYYGKRNTYLTDDAKTLSGVGKKERYGIDLYYNHWPFGFTYEFVVGRDGQTFGNSLNDPKLQDVISRSHTATLFLSFGEQFVAGFRNQGRYDDWWPKTYQPFVRFDSYTRRAHTPERVDVLTGGINIFFAETTKFQLNYNWRRDQRVILDIKQPAALRHPSHEVLVQFQYGF